MSRVAVQPKSMPGPIRNVIRSNDSASLWNFTISPGWTMEEVDVLHKALMKEGMGAWKAIIYNNYLPGKTRAQICLQTQRMLGQQTLAPFEGLHLDPKRVYEANSALTGVRRKNGLIINEGAYPTRDEILRRRAANKEKYGLSDDEIRAITVPRLSPKGGYEDTEEEREARDMARALGAKLGAMKKALAILKAQQQEGAPAVAGSSGVGQKRVSDGAPMDAETSAKVART